MTPKTLRRKLQKKKKRRPYGHCPMCGERTERRVVGECSVHRCVKKDGPRLIDKCPKCPWTKELFWLGGGTGRHIHQPSQDERG